MLIDTHCHLHDSEWFTPEEQTQFLTEAKRAGVEKVICIGTSHEDSLAARDFATAHENIYWTYGIHPEFANDASVATLMATGRGDASLLFDNGDVLAGRQVCSFWEGAELTSEHAAREARDDGSERRVSQKDANCRPDKLVAIGEIGLDYHYSGYNRPAQIHLFEQMLQLATDLNLPVSLHIREAFADAFAVLDNFPHIRGVVHSFTGNKKELKQALDRGFYIGVNGLATYSTLPLPPTDRILLETDAPFLTPVPFRGTINKPGYVREIAAYLATKLGVTELKIAEQTTNNARQVFKIHQ